MLWWVGLASCISLLLHHNITAVMQPITFTGDGYARYTLLDSGITKRQVALEMAFYEESISMRIQTDVEEGLLFRMGGVTDFAVLEVSI